MQLSALPSVLLDKSAHKLALNEVVGSGAFPGVDVGGAVELLLGDGRLLLLGALEDVADVPVVHRRHR